MKRIPFLLLAAIASTTLLLSCRDTETYAEQLSAEKELIASYIKRNNINVLKVLPKPDKWGPKDYYLTKDGLYIHLVDSGVRTSKEDTVETGSLVIPRFNEFTLTEPADTTVYNWSNQDYPFPADFILGNTSQSCIAFHEAARVMLRNNAVALLIVPSKLGFQATQMTKATPYGYKIRIKFQK